MNFNLRYWIYSALIGTIICGAGNTIAHAKRGQENKDKPLIRHCALGMLTGLCLGVFEYAVGLIPKIGPSLQFIYIVYCLLLLIITIIGIATSSISQGVKGLKKAFYIYIGLFYLDENYTWRSVLHGFLRHTYEIPQTFIGYLYSQARCTGSHVSKVEYYGGSTFVINEQQLYQDGISLGNYPNINLWSSIPCDIDLAIGQYPILLHEYGHTIDSRRFGWLYLIVIGLPSVRSAMGKGNHSIFWTEKRANRNVKSYLAKTSDITWDNYESNYPTT
ncbi:MAG: hypothetical protein K6A28_05870 [Bacteroidales bacterium]|nr:hypothetical protein [Bacteroidales bacterium]